ncbi:MAG: VWA domain-containing protein [Acidobacteriia bacterium]|nr:VWA domain-containing protein [Terriglobia bacterium]
MPNKFIYRGRDLSVSIGLSLLLLISVPSWADKKPKTRAPKESDTQTFKVVVDLISVNAIVNSKNGDPIKDLTQDDFLILEDGVPQKISHFKVEVAEGVTVPASSKENPAGTEESVVLLSRKIILFVDDYHIEFGDLARLKKAGTDFIRNSLGPDDVIALITASGKNSTELTKSREHVISNLNNIFPLLMTHRATNDCPPLNDLQASSISERGEEADEILKMPEPLQVCVLDTIDCANLSGTFNRITIAANMCVSAARGRNTLIMYDSRRTLSSVQALARRLKSIEGPKTVVFLSDGFLTRQAESQIQEAIDAAIRANTVFEAIDTGGLRAYVPGGDASSSITTTAQSFAARMRMDRDEAAARQDALNALASDTGGHFLHNNNDLLAQLKRASQPSPVRYVLGYYSTNSTRDGKFRKLAVKVNRPDVAVTARKGYLAPRGEEAFETAKNNDLDEALRIAHDLKEIPVTVGYHITHLEPSRTLLAVQTRIDVRKIRFHKRENRNQNIFTILTVVYDANGRYVDGWETRIDFNLTDPGFKNVMDEGLIAQARFQLEPGSYKVKAVVREAGETKLGSATKTIEIMD